MWKEQTDTSTFVSWNMLTYSTLFYCFSSTWISSTNFTCHKIKLDPLALCEDCEEEVEPEDVTNCEVVVDNDDNTVMCEDNRQYLALVNSCLGKKCCGYGKVWSRYRNRCVRNFKRFK